MQELRQRQQEALEIFRHAMLRADKGELARLTMKMLSSDALPAHAGIDPDAYIEECNTALRDIKAASKHPNAFLGAMGNLWEVTHSVGSVAYSGFFLRLLLEEGMTERMHLGEANEETKAAVGLFIAAQAAMMGGLFISAWGNHKSKSHSAMVADLGYVAWLAIQIGVSMKEDYGASSAPVAVGALAFSLWLFTGRQFFDLKTPAVDGVELDGARRGGAMTGWATAFTLGFLADTIVSNTDQFIGPLSPLFSKLPGGEQFWRNVTQALTKTVALICYNFMRPYITKWFAGPDAGDIADIRTRAEWHWPILSLENLYSILDNTDKFASFISAFVGLLTPLGTLVLGASGDAAIKDPVKRNAALTALDELVCEFLCVQFEIQDLKKKEDIDSFMAKPHPEVDAMLLKMATALQLDGAMNSLNDPEVMGRLVIEMLDCVKSLPSNLDKGLFALRLFFQTAPNIFTQTAATDRVENVLSGISREIFELSSSEGSRTPGSPRAESSQQPLSSGLFPLSEEEEPALGDRLAAMVEEESPALSPAREGLTEDQPVPGLEATPRDESDERPASSEQSMPAP